MQLLLLQLCKHRLLCLLIGTFARLKRWIRFRKVIDDAVEAVIVLLHCVFHSAKGSSSGISFRKPFRMKNDLHTVYHLGIVEDNTIQPFLAFMPAAHGNDLTAFAKETEIIVGAFKSVIGITGCLHRCNQRILICRSIMYRLPLDAIWQDSRSM